MARSENVFDVSAEHARSRPLTLTDLKRFIRDGVPPAALSWTPCGQVSMVARDRVVFDAPGGLGSARFEFARNLRDDGAAVNAYTVPLLDAAGHLSDILAWRPDGAAGLWNGVVSVAGEEQVLAPRLDEALDVHVSVMNWLRAGRLGIVILSHPKAAEGLAGLTLRAETSHHARQLWLRLSRPAPRIVVPRLSPAFNGPEAAKARVSR